MSKNLTTTNYYWAALSCVRTERGAAQHCATRCIVFAATYRDMPQCAKDAATVMELLFHNDNIVCPTNRDSEFDRYQTDVAKFVHADWHIISDWLKVDRMRSEDRFAAMSFFLVAADELITSFRCGRSKYLFFSEPNDGRVFFSTTVLSYWRFTARREATIYRYGLSILSHFSHRKYFKIYVVQHYMLISLSRLCLSRHGK